MAKTQTAAKTVPPTGKTDNIDEQPQTALVEVGGLISDEQPDFLKSMDTARGTENVGVNDLIVPRLEIVQSLSPCKDKTDPNYIPGIEEGELYNNVTRQRLGAEVLVCPVYYRTEWLVWKDRKKGGGFRGSFASEAEAKARIDELEDDEGEDCEVVDTAQHFCLLIDPVVGKISEIVLSMSRSKRKVSRRWNSLIRINEGDSFSRIYRVGAVTEANAQNQKYFNFVVSPAGFPSRTVFERAGKLYGMIKEGMVKVDQTFEEADAGGASVGKTEY